MSSHLELLSKLSNDELVILLAKRAVFNKHAAEMRKQAMPDFSAMASGLADRVKGLAGDAKNWAASNPGLDAVKDWIRQNPAAVSTLAGAGIGAAGGGLTSLGSRSKRKHWMRNAVTGAIAGGAVGGGGYLAARALRPNGVVEPSGPLPAPPAKSQTPIPFVHNGKPYNLDPNKATPEVLQRVNELQQLTPTQIGVGGLGAALWQYPKNHPILASMLGLDVTGAAAKRLNTMRGASIPLSINPDDYRLGAQQILAGKIPDLTKLEDGDSLKKLVAALSAGSGPVQPSDLRQALLRARLNPTETVHIPGIGSVTPGNLQRISEASGRRQSGPGAIMQLMSDLRHRLTGKGGGPLAGTGFKSEGDPIAGAKKILSDIGFDRANNAHRRALGQFRVDDFTEGDTVKRILSGLAPSSGDKPGPFGRKTYDVTRYSDAEVKALRDLIAKAKAGGGIDPIITAPNTAGSRLLRAMNSGKTRNYFLPKSRYGNIAGRAGLYAGVPLLTHLLRSGREYVGNRERLQELIDQIAEPVQ